MELHELSVNNSQENSTFPGNFEEVQFALRFFDASVFFLIWFLTLISTILIFLLFNQTVRLREVSGYLMVTLTSIDFLTAQFFLFPSIYTVVAHEIPWGQSVLCDIQGFMNLYLQNFKALTITLCALDRVFSIASPFSYSRLATTFNFWISFVTITVLASVLPVIQFSFYGWRGGPDIDSGICWAVPPDANLSMYYIGMVLNAFMPGAVVLICYGIIIGIVVSQRSAIQQQHSVAAKQSSHDSRKSTVQQAGVTFFSHLGACKMLFIVTILYFLTFVPIIVADHALKPREAILDLVLYHFCNYLFYVSVCMNFVIYYRMNKAFKLSFKTRFLRTKLGRRLSASQKLSHIVTQQQVKLDVEI